jgi:LemA protein
MKQVSRRALQVAVVLAVGFGLPGCSYNRFTSQEEMVKQQWSEIQNQLQRRNDLIGNLVETVKGYAAQERDIFIQVAESRAKLAGAKTPAEQIEAANEQSAALSRLLVVVENYPQLKSNETFLRLMDQIEGTENRIAVARGRYNEAARNYNTLRRRFPSNVTAKVFGFKEYPYFEAPADAKKAPKVDFSRDK